MATEQVAEIPCTHSDPCYRVRYTVSSRVWADWVIDQRCQPRGMEQEWAAFLVGHLKWDGCMEWRTPRDHIHVCQQNDLDEIAAALTAVRRIVGAAIPAWDGDE